MPTEQEKRLQRCCFTGQRPEKLTESPEAVQQWLKEQIENAIDTSMADYPEFPPIKNERATSTIGWSSETELADEYWAMIKTALEAAIKQKKKRQTGKACSQAIVTGVIMDGINYCMRKEIPYHKTSWPW
jgi:hypothetical protein